MGCSHSFYVTRSGDLRINSVTISNVCLSQEIFSLPFFFFFEIRRDSVESLKKKNESFFFFFKADSTFCLLRSGELMKM